MGRQDGTPLLRLSLAEGLAGQGELSIESQVRKNQWQDGLVM